MRAMSRSKPPVTERCWPPRNCGPCHASSPQFRNGAAAPRTLRNGRGSRPRLPHGKLPPLQRCLAPRILLSMSRFKTAVAARQITTRFNGAGHRQHCGGCRGSSPQLPDGKLLADYRISTVRPRHEFPPPTAAATDVAIMRSCRGEMPKCHFSKFQPAPLTAASCFYKLAIVRGWPPRRQYRSHIQSAYLNSNPNNIVLPNGLLPCRYVRSKLLGGIGVASDRDQDVRRSGISIQG